MWIQWRKTHAILIGSQKKKNWSRPNQIVVRPITWVVSVRLGYALYMEGADKTLDRCSCSDHLKMM